VMKRMSRAEMMMAASTRCSFAFERGLD